MYATGIVDRLYCDRVEYHLSAPYLLSNNMSTSQPVSNVVLRRATFLTRPLFALTFAAFSELFFISLGHGMLIPMTSLSWRDDAASYCVALRGASSLLFAL